MAWASHWSVALHTFYRQIFSLLYIFFFETSAPGLPGSTCMIVGGSHIFHKKVLIELKNRYLFKYWKVGGGMFLGRNIDSNSDGYGGYD